MNVDRKRDEKRRDLDRKAARRAKRNQNMGV